MSLHEKSQAKDERKTKSSQVKNPFGFDGMCLMGCKRKKSAFIGSQRPEQAKRLKNESEPYNLEKKRLLHANKLQWKCHRTDSFTKGTASYISMHPQHLPLCFSGFMYLRSWIRIHSSGTLTLPQQDIVGHELTVTIFSMHKKGTLGTYEWHVTSKSDGVPLTNTVQDMTSDDIADRPWKPWQTMMIGHDHGKKKLRLTAIRSSRCCLMFHFTSGS